jgi:hypothetical protein
LELFAVQRFKTWGRDESNVERTSNIWRSDPAPHWLKMLMSAAAYVKQ